MKKIDTAYISNKKADFNEIEYIIENLFTEDSEEWLCLFDTSENNPNYIQIHSDIEEFEDEATNFMVNVLDYDTNVIDEIKELYLIEYRKYTNKDDFKHYRAFFDKPETIISYFEKYMNDETLNVEQWIDVTEEFEE